MATVNQPGPAAVTGPRAHRSSARSPGLAYLDAESLSALVDGPGAVRVLAEALRSGWVDPEQDSSRLFAPAGPGAEFLMMPTAADAGAGVKVVTLAPQNPAHGHPTVQGVYILFESERFAPVAVLDAAELTLVRTPATTVMAAQHLLAAKQRLDVRGPDGPAVRAPRTVVFGTGPQAERHITCLNTVLTPDDIAVAGRRREAVDRVVARTAAQGAPARAAGDLTDELGRADLIVCVTSSPTPLFEADRVSADTVLCAVGVHGPQKRELPPELVRRSDVVVEGRASAMRESGNLLGARTAEEWTADTASPLSNLADLAAGRFTLSPGRPAIYSGVGMAWEDLVIATHAYASYRGTPA